MGNIHIFSWSKEFGLCLSHATSYIHFFNNVKGLDAQQTGNRYLYAPTPSSFDYSAKCNQGCWSGLQACRELNFIQGRRTYGVRNSVSWAGSVCYNDLSRCFIPKCTQQYSHCIPRDCTLTYTKVNIRNI